MRRIFVGDLHGCLEPLERLLEAVGFRGDDRLLSVGDLVGKGPEPAATVRRLKELHAEPVLGNHDLAWLRDGRLADPELEAWLRAQPILRLFDDVILVHAGLHPSWDEAKLRVLATTPVALADPDVDFAVNVRYCTASGTRPESDWPPPAAPYRPWDDLYSGPRRVVFGHWARRGLDVREHAIALDSGCVYGNPLSAWIAEEDRIVQVPGLVRAR